MFLRRTQSLCQHELGEGFEFWLAQGRKRRDWDRALPTRSSKPSPSSSWHSDRGRLHPIEFAGAKHGAPATTERLRRPGTSVHDPTGVDRPGDRHCTGAPASASCRGDPRRHGVADGTSCSNVERIRGVFASFPALRRPFAHSSLAMHGLVATAVRARDGCWPLPAPQARASRSWPARDSGPCRSPTTA